MYLAASGRPLKVALGRLGVGTKYVPTSVQWERLSMQVPESAVYGSGEHSG